MPSGRRAPDRGALISALPWPRSYLRHCRTFGALDRKAAASTSSCSVLFLMSSVFPASSSGGITILSPGDPTLVPAALLPGSPLSVLRKWPQDLSWLESLQRCPNLRGPPTSCIGRSRPLTSPRVVGLYPTLSPPSTHNILPFWRTCSLIPNCLDLPWSSLGVEGPFVTCCHLPHTPSILEPPCPHHPGRCFPRHSFPWP